MCAQRGFVLALPELKRRYSQNPGRVRKWDPESVLCAQRSFVLVLPDLKTISNQLKVVYCPKISCLIVSIV